MRKYLPRPASPPPLPASPEILQAIHPCTQTSPQNPGVNRKPWASLRHSGPRTSGQGVLADSCGVDELYGFLRGSRRALLVLRVFFSCWVLVGFSEVLTGSYGVLAVFYGVLVRLDGLF